MPLLWCCLSTHKEGKKMSYEKITSNLIIKLETSIDALLNLAQEEANRIDREKKEAFKLRTEEEKIQRFEDIAETDKSNNYNAMIRTLKNALSIVKNEVEELSKKK